MLRKIDLIEDADRDVIVVETVYSNDHLVSAHTHKRVQLLHATTGIMQLDTKYGAWVVPPGFAVWIPVGIVNQRSEEHTSELQSLMRISYAVFCLEKNKKQQKPI